MKGKIKRSKNHKMLEDGKGSPLQKAAETFEKATESVERAKRLGHQPTIDYSKKAQMWAAGELDEAIKRTKKRRSSGKHGGKGGQNMK